MENPSTPESNWGICLRDFWIERIMRCVPCIFCELRGRGVCVMRRRFISGTWRSLFAVLSNIRAEYVERACTSSLPRVVDIYTKVEEGRKRRGGMYSLHSLLVHSHQNTHAFFYKPAQANILVTLLDPRLNVTLCAQQKGII